MRATHLLHCMPLTRPADLAMKSGGSLSAAVPLTMGAWRRKRAAMRRILLIEDDAVFRDHVTQAMRLAGFELRCAADGEAGWAALGPANPDLILLDLVFHGMSGLPSFAASVPRTTRAGI